MDCEKSLLWLFYMRELWISETGIDYIKKNDWNRYFLWIYFKFEDEWRKFPRNMTELPKCEGSLLRWGLVCVSLWIFSYEGYGTWINKKFYFKFGFVSKKSFFLFWCGRAKTYVYLIGLDPVISGNCLGIMESCFLKISHNYKRQLGGQISKLNVSYKVFILI